MVATCELYQEERDVLERETRKVKVGGRKSFDKLDSSEERISMLGDRLWPQAANQGGDTICKRCLCHKWKKRSEG
ncbi:unnamed protein product [Sphacelaria rigidula]